MTKKLILGATAGALGGLLFGFDTAVISGAEQSLKVAFELEGFWHGFTNAIALIGTIFGAMFAGKPGDKYGRKKVLIAVALFYGISALGSGLAQNWHTFFFYRFLGGLGVGASSVLGPMYISEISPRKIRGRLVATFQFCIVFGILLAFFSNYLINSLVEVAAWRWMLGVETIPAIIFLSLLFFIDESPRWLVKKNRDAEAQQSLEELGTKNPGKVMKDIIESLKAEKSGIKEKLFSKKYSFPIALAVALATFNQFSGINAIMYYAPRIFEMTGLATDTALLQSTAIGLTNMIFTVLAMTIIDKFGRKTLLTVGSVGMILFLGLTASAFYTQDFSGYSVLIYLIGFIAFFAFSQGAVIWVFLSEIFPNAVREQGQGLGSLTHWVWAAALTWTFPVVAEMNYGGAIAFSFFAAAMVLQLIFVLKWLPETKEKSLEQIEKDLNIRSGVEQSVVSE